MSALDIDFDDLSLAGNGGTVVTVTVDGIDSADLTITVDGESATNVTLTADDFVF